STSGTEAYRLSLTTPTFLPTSASALAFASEALGGGRVSRELWYRILNAEGNPSPVDRAGAYLGLCQNFSAARSPGSANGRNTALLGYFYCKRAATVFRRLPARLASHAGARDVESRVAYQLGEVFRRFDATGAVSGPQWTCDPSVARLPVV